MTNTNKNNKNDPQKSIALEWSVRKLLNNVSRYQPEIVLEGKEVKVYFKWSYSSAAPLFSINSQVFYNVPVHINLFVFAVFVSL